MFYREGRVEFQAGVADVIVDADREVILGLALGVAEAACERVMLLELGSGTARA